MKARRSREGLAPPRLHGEAGLPAVGEAPSNIPENQEAPATASLIRANLLARPVLDDAPASLRRLWRIASMIRSDCRTAFGFHARVWTSSPRRLGPAPFDDWCMFRRDQSGPGCRFGAQWGPQPNAHPANNLEFQQAEMPTPEGQGHRANATGTTSGAIFQRMRTDDPTPVKQSGHKGSSS